MAERVEFRVGEGFAGATGPFNLVISNPPYIADPERATLQPEVAVHEPADALFAGPDGLAVIRQIIREAEQLLDEDGTLVMEVGAGQIERVAEIADETAQLALVRARQDLAGIPRVAVVRRCR